MLHTAAGERVHVHANGCPIPWYGLKCMYVQVPARPLTCTALPPVLTEHTHKSLIINGIIARGLQQRQTDVAWEASILSSMNLSRNLQIGWHRQTTVAQTDHLRINLGNPHAATANLPSPRHTPAWFLELSTRDLEQLSPASRGSPCAAFNNSCLEQTRRTSFHLVCPWKVSKCVINQGHCSRGG